MRLLTYMCVLVLAPTVAFGQPASSEGRNPQRSQQPRSQVLTEVRERDWEADGVPDSREIISNTYDGRGRLTSTTIASDSRADGTVVVERTTTTTYDRRGNAVKTVMRWSSGSWTATTNTYDLNGHILQSVYDSDWNGDGAVDYSRPTTYTYDTRGNLATIVVDWGWAYIVTTNTYDRNGRVIGQLVEWDVDWEGHPDGTTDYRSTTAYVYDQRGNLLSSLSEGDFYDSDDDWFYKGYSRRINTYDHRGKLLTTTWESPWSGGDIQVSGTVRNSYDRQGRLQRQVQEYDEGSDGAVDYRDTTVNTYDPRGMVLTTVVDWEWMGEDSIYTSRRTTTNRYDPRGNIVMQVIEDDGNADSLPDFRQTKTYTYDSFGNLVGLQTEFDPNLDGQADYVTTTMWTYRDARK